MELVVRKVQVVGANFYGLRRTGLREEQIKWMKGRGVGATVHVIKDGTPGTIRMRLDDLPSSMLSHTLLPGMDALGFVQPRDMAEVAKILESIPQALARFEVAEKKEIDWGSLPFDINLAEETTMFVAKVKHTLDQKGHTIRGSWEEQNKELEACLYPFSATLESPAAQVKHYGQAVFEGIKAFRQESGRIVIFRLEENAKRLARSARRLGMTPVPLEMFLKAVRATILANKDLIPPSGKMAAMYIRPVQYGSGPRLGVKEAGEETLIIFVSPVGPYYQGGTIKPIHIKTPSSNIRRSATGLTGGVKAAGNYVMGLIELIKAKEKGFNEVLWVRSHRDELYPEESGSSNLFWVIDGELYTPELTDTILPGITRDSVIKLARAFGMRVHEVEMPLSKVLERASEMFCTGTAAVITPIASVTHEGEKRVFNNSEVGPITQKLYRALVALQEGRDHDPALEGIRPDLLDEFKQDWIYVVEA